MQSKTTLKRIAGILQRSLTILALFCFFTGKINAQVFVNGNLTTGATASTGDPAPAGFTWSEVQLGNGNAGYAANITNGFSLADDFTVTCGTWDITKFTCYSYSTNYAGATSPVIDVRMQIFDTDPSVGNPTPIYGDLTTNRLTTSTSSDMYRIFNAAPATDRQIWKNEVSITGLSLVPGTYWVEWQIGLQTGLVSNFSPASTVVGSTTQAGNNAMQHTLAGNTWAPLLDGPTGNDPQDMPFRLDFNTTACAGTPDPGATVSTETTVCPATPFTLSPANVTCGAGVTYQWQSSPTGTAGTFTDISGATNGTLTTTLAAQTYYQVVVTCTASSQTGTSTPVMVDLSPTSQCVCIPNPSDCTDGDIITNVSINQLNNTSTCEPNGYINYGADLTVPIPDVVQGIANPITVTAGGGVFDEVVAVWIDYDHSGNFDASEYSAIGGTTGGTLSANINVPATALMGNTRMRVRVQFLNDFLPTDACTDAFIGFGETEDYFVNIIPCVQGSFTSQPANTSTSCGNDVSIGVSVTGTLITYQWQQKVGAGPWTNVTNVAPFSGATTDTLRIAAAPASLDGNQYRVIIGGGCTALDFSDIVTLTVTPLVINVSPASVNSCDPIPATAPVQVSITTVPGGSVSTTNTYSSGPVNIIIPDNDQTGITSTINAPALPAGAVVTRVSAILNIDHTYVGDLFIALKAPNTNILNLDYSLTALGGGVSTGFLNTEIGSDGIATLGSGTDPYTGLFAADAFPPVAGFPDVCTSLSATPCNVTNFSGLYSVPDGAWTLGIYDGFNLDEGTLVDWTLSITYTIAASAPYTGVWSPVTNLYLDPAGTIPYAGTPESTVYAAPSTTTNYSVVVTTPSCTSDPLIVPVIIGASLGTFVDQPRDTLVCAGETATFTADASASGTPTAYQWQVSHDGGATFSDVAGATSSTLTLTAAGTDDGNVYQLVLSSTTCPGSVTSNTAVLHVASPPVVTVTATPYTSIYPGLRTELKAVATPTTPDDIYQWYYNGDLIPGATSSTFEVNFGNTGIGEFSVDVTDTGTVCRIAANAKITITDSASNTLFIWPNPSTGLFQVRYNDGGLNDIRSGAPYLQVYDSKGARIFSQVFAQLAPYQRMDVDLSKQPKGTYIVVLYSADGKLIKTGRVVIR